MRAPNPRFSRIANRRILWLAAFALAIAALPAAARYVKHLDLEVATPVYVLPDEAAVPAERLDYVLRWSGLPVATASITMTESDDASSVAMEATGATHPVIDWLYRYRFWGDARVRTAPFRPERFDIDECKNQRHDRTEIRFTESGGSGEVGWVRGVRHRKGRVKEYVFRSDNAFDIPSATYLLLNLDYAAGSVYELDTFTGKSRYLLRAEVVGLESVEVDGVATPAWRLRLFTRELTDDDEDDHRHRETQVWVSPERPRRLLFASSQTFVGPMTVQLVSAEAGPGRSAPDRRAHCG